jgi:predicted MFS family arabinose efflux permease
MRHTALGLDGVALEAAAVIGPGAGILLATNVSAAAAMSAEGLAFGVLTVALLLFNPPLRSRADDEVAGRTGLSRRSWLSRPVVTTLLVVLGAQFVVAGTEVAALASLGAINQTAWMSAVIAAMCLASIVGGVIYGSYRGPVSPVWLLTGFAALTLPAVVAHQSWLLLAFVLFLPNLACAPTIAASGGALSELVPGPVRGEAMGLFDAAIRVGLALGSPVVGLVLDRAGPAAGFLTVAGGGMLMAVCAVLLTRLPRIRPGHRRRQSARTATHRSSVV